MLQCVAYYVMYDVEERQQVREIFDTGVAWSIAESSPFRYSNGPEHLGTVYLRECQLRVTIGQTENP